MPRLAFRVALSRLVALLACGVTAAALHAQNPAPTLEPEWVWQMQPGIEWVELVGHSDAATLLVATRAAQLQLLDLATGKARLVEPIAVGRGVRPARGNPAEQTGKTMSGEGRAAAGGPSGVAYCFDRHAVYAVRFCETAGLKWQHGAGPPDGEGFQGDPEILTGWVGAHVTAAGLLLVNSDGRVVLLSHADGRVRWEVDLGRLAITRLHVLGNTAVVLWKTRGKVQAGFLELGDQQPTLTRRDLGRMWPVWSTLLRDGLLTVSPASVVLWPKEGPPHRPNIRTPLVRAAAVDVFAPEPHAAADGSPASSPPALLLLGSGTSLLAYDLSTGEELWHQCARPASGPDIQTMTVRGQRVLSTYRSGARVWDVATGKLAGSWLEHPPARLVSAGLIGRRLHVLLVEEDGAQSSLLLRCLELAESTASRPGTNVAVPTTLSLDPAPNIRQVIWAERYVVLVEPGGLRAYKLP